ncbi:MAG: hypothetical protein K5978_02420 [Campylobacter sp.]|nr:hypothetical protein [Campylobacter sp.]
MDMFFTSYRDPMFGIVVLIFIVFMVAILSYVWGIFKTKDEKKNLEKFMKKFDSLNSLSDKHIKLLQNLEIDAQSLSLLGSTFAKNGDFEKAISVYIIALGKIKNKAQKEFILSELGKVYFKAGFMQNSMEVFLKAVELSPRNALALRFLTMIDEKLKLYDDALETLVSLNELGVDTKANVAYIKALKIMNDKNIEPTQKVQKMLELKADFPLVARMCMQTFIRQGVNLKNLPHFPVLSDVIDLVNSSDTAINLSDDDYKEFFFAKSMIDETTAIKSFELNVLRATNLGGYKKATLGFSYICKHCKNAFPMHFYRCPMCHELASVSIKTHITEKSDENHMPF